MSKQIDLEKLRAQSKNGLPMSPGYVLELLDHIAALEKDAARYRDFKKNSHIRFSQFSGRFRADNGNSIITDWVESFDECFDTAMEASNAKAD